MEEKRDPSEIVSTPAAGEAFGRVFRFEGVEVDAASGSVRRDGRTEYLRLKTAEVLLALLRNRHRTVTKEELMDAIWKDAVVDGDALVQCVMEIRKALGDDSRNPRFVRTVSRVGYRFVGEATEITASPRALTLREETSVEIEERREVVEDEPRALLPPVRGARTGLLVIGTVAAALALAIAFLALRRSPLATSVSRVPGRKGLAVLLFDNQSGSSDLDWLRAGLTDMVISDLSASGEIEVLSRQQLAIVLERAGSAGREPLPLAKAVEVARRSGAEAFVLGGFTRIGDRVRIQVQLHETASGALLAAESVTAERPELIFASVDLVSNRLLARLSRTTAPTPVAGLAAAMTGNLEAYRLYSLALERLEGVHNREAIELLEKAVALDPGFAMAHARIGYAYAVHWGERERGRPYLEKAFRLSERLGPNDRLRITAWYENARNDFPATIRAYRELVRKEPLELESYARLASLLSGEERIAEALEVTARALALDPQSPELHNQRSGLLIDSGRFEEGIAEARRYVELAPAEPNAYDTLGLSLQTSGRYQEAAEAYRRALAKKPDFEVAVVHLGNTLIAQGRYREALEQFRRYIAIASSDNERNRGRESIAFVLTRLGQSREAEQALGDVPGQLAFRLALARKDLAAAREMHTHVAATASTERGRRHTARPELWGEGMLALSTGERDRAVQLLREALRHRPQKWHYDRLEDCLGNALLSLSRYDEAEAEYQRVLKLDPRYPLARYHLALAFEGKGDAPRARAELERFLADWKGADPEVPEVRDAKRRLGIPYS